MRVREGYQEEKGRYGRLSVDAHRRAWWWHRELEPRPLPPAEKRRLVERELEAGLATSSAVSWSSWKSAMSVGRPAT